jgi:hypothetical protein
MDVVFLSCVSVHIHKHSAWLYTVICKLSSKYQTFILVVLASISAWSVTSRSKSCASSKTSSVRGEKIIPFSWDWLAPLTRKFLTVGIIHLAGFLGVLEWYNACICSFKLLSSVSWIVPHDESIHVLRVKRFSKRSEVCILLNFV